MICKILKSATITNECTGITLEFKIGDIDFTIISMGLDLTDISWLSLIYT